MTDEQLPAPLARLWRRATESRLGRPAKLDVDQVVQAAVALADRGGLSGVTLPKVAETLGVTKMSLYRYVGSKDELLVLMSDFASGPVPPIDFTQWRSGLRDWAHALLRVNRDRPWLSRIPMSGPPSGPNGIGWMDAGLRALSATSLDWGSKLSAITVLSGFVTANAQLTIELAEGRRDTGLDQTEAEREYGRALVGLVEQDRFPEAAKLFRSDLFENSAAISDDEAAEYDFIQGLELILDGVAAAIDAAN